MAIIFVVNMATRAITTKRTIIAIDIAGFYTIQTHFHFQMGLLVVVVVVTIIIVMRIIGGN
jgi:hypothetical protein